MADEINKEDSANESEITKDDIEKEIKKILKTSDLQNISMKALRQQLEKELGAPMKAWASTISKIAMDYVDELEEAREKAEAAGGASGSEDESDDDKDGVTKEDVEREAKKILKASDQSVSVKKLCDQLEKKLGGSVTRWSSVLKKLAAAHAQGLRKDDSESASGSESEDSEAEKRKKSSKKPAAKGRKRKVSGDSDYEEPKATKKSGKGRGKGSGYTRAYKLSPALSELMGADSMPRHEVVKRVWAMIKEKKLYDPSNRQFAICDDALYKVIGTKRFRTFGMMKYLKTHFLDD